jgi:hypothetical protein
VGNSYESQATSALKIPDEVGRRMVRGRTFHQRAKAGMKVNEPGLRRPKNDSDPPMLPRIRRLIGADSIR